MRMSLVCFVLTALLIPSSAFSQTREEKVRNDRLRVSKSGLWHYNDMAAGFAESQRTSKPLMVVFRCIPCVECVKLDDDLMEQNSEILEGLKRFVRVRQISNNGLELKRIQFDFDQSFTVLFFHPDGTLMGRYGTRSHHSEWKDDVSIEGLAEAMKQVLTWYENYDSVRPLLAGKQSSELPLSKLIPNAGPQVETIEEPQQFPTLTKFPSKLNLDDQPVKNCIHCHQIGDAQKAFALTLNLPEGLPEKLLFPYPHPKSIGLIMDVNACSTIQSVTADSFAESSGLKAGDRIVEFGGEAPLSIADLQWVLHKRTNQAEVIPVVVDRDGTRKTLQLQLAEDWKSNDDIAWRVSTWELRRIALGGMVLKDLTEAEHKDAPEGALFHVGHVGQYAPHNRAQVAGVKKDDWIVSIEGRTDFTRETDVIRYLLTTREKDTPIAIEVLRNGKRSKLQIARK